jgi:NDP-sugar pyrophosphorylase family protein
VDTVSVGHIPRRCTEVGTMDVRAIIMVGGAAETPTDSGRNERLAETPLGLADVLGKPVVYRVIDRLREADINSVTIISEAGPEVWPAGTADGAHGTWIHATGEGFWRIAEQTFCEYAQAGAELIVVQRVGAYTEIDYDELLQFHLDRAENVTRVVDNTGGQLDLFAISASRPNDAAHLLRNRFRRFRSSTTSYEFNGYTNRLSGPMDYRQFAIDGLMLRVNIPPVGSQIRPGVWAGKGAKIHRRARILTPAYIGAGVRVCATAVITRCSSIEHHSIVDCGTVVENVTALPYTYLGAGLDVTHSVAGHRRLWNLKRNVEVEFSDSTFVDEASAHAPLRALTSLVSLTTFVPVQFVRGLLAPLRGNRTPALPEAIQARSSLNPTAPRKAPAPSVDAGDFPSNLIVARRYGNE